MNTWTTLQYATNLSSLVVLMLGLLTSLFVLVSFILYYRGQYKFKTRIAPFCLILMCTIIGLNNGLLFMFNLYNSYLSTPWCYFIGLSATFVTGGAMFSHGLMAFERYFIVLYSQDLSWSFIWSYFIALYLFIATIMLCALGWSPSKYVVFESGLYCYYHFTSPHPADRIASILVVSISLGFSQLILFLYWQVYKKTKQITTEIKEVASTGIMQTRVGHRLTLLEKRVFYRCLLLVGCFMTIYTPITVAFGYRLVSGRSDVIMWLDCLVLLMTEFDPLVTPILVCYMSSDFRVAVLFYLPHGIKNRLEQRFQVSLPIDSVGESIYTTRPPDQSADK